MIRGTLTVFAFVGPIILFGILLMAVPLFTKTPEHQKAVWNWRVYGYIMGLALFYIAMAVLLWGGTLVPFYSLQQAWPVIIGTLVVAALVWGASLLVKPRYHTRQQLVKGLYHAAQLVVDQQGRPGGADTEQRFVHCKRAAEEVKLLGLSSNPPYGRVDEDVIIGAILSIVDNESADSQEVAVEKAYQSWTKPRDTALQNLVCARRT